MSSVELRGLEPLTPSMPIDGAATSCAKAPGAEREIQWS